ncbi:MAG: DoxX family protein [Gammaproteobacteria bacterium]|nr:DoxX family protein [Gammaproteobacteria bacterium]
MKLMRQISSLFVRLAIGVSFLSAVADRFGFWGDFSQFQAYTAAKLNWFMPSAAIPALAWISTGAETLLGAALIAGIYTRAAALLSGLLLLLFALSMSFALGLEAPLSVSVFSASAGAFLLSTCAEYPFSIDHLASRRQARSQRT